MHQGEPFGISMEMDSKGHSLLVYVIKKKYKRKYGSL